MDGLPFGLEAGLGNGPSVHLPGFVNGGFQGFDCDPGSVWQFIDGALTVSSGLWLSGGVLLGSAF